MKKKLGATGQFPEGKLNEDDEGELSFAIFVDKGNVIVDFSTPVSWFGMNKEIAISLAKAILKNAEKL